jgi:hypothetical protein
VGAHEPLPPVAARQLYNLADALLPPEPGAVALDWMPGVEAVLRRRRPRERRKLLTLLGALEVRSRLLAWRGFFELPRERRARLLRRLPRAHRAWLGRLLAEAARESGHSPGAEDGRSPGAEDGHSPGAEDGHSSGA